MMNHRERVLAALNHKEPDAIPADLGGMGSTGIMAVAYARFREELGLEKRKVRINDIGQQLAEIDADVLDLCDASVININRTLPPAVGVRPKLRDFPLLDFSLNPPQSIPAELIADGLKLERRADAWALLDSKGDVEFQKPDTAYYFDRVKCQLGSASTIADIAAYKWQPPPRKYFEKLRKHVSNLRKNTDRALMASFGGNILEMGQCLRGWGEFMMDLASDGPFTHYLLDYMADKWMEHLGLYMEAVGDLIDVIVFGDDLGTQQSPQLSVGMYRRTIHPRHKKLYSYVREHHPEVRVFLHSCGAIRPLIPLLIDEGVQVLNPVQTSAVDMDPVELKKEFGRDLVFWGGGIDTQHTLPFGAPGEIRDTVRQRMDIFGEGGGFVFCQVHNIQASIPPSNILAMVNAVREYNGRSPIG